MGSTCKDCLYWAQKSKKQVSDVIIYGDCSNPEIREHACSLCGTAKMEPLYKITDSATMEAYTEWMPHRDFGCIKFTPNTKG